jgi:hypothetical protein
MILAGDTERLQAVENGGGMSLLTLDGTDTLMAARPCTAPGAVPPGP